MCRQYTGFDATADMQGYYPLALKSASAVDVNPFKCGSECGWIVGIQLYHFKMLCVFRLFTIDILQHNPY